MGSPERRQCFLHRPHEVQLSSNWRVWRALRVYFRRGETIETNEAAIQLKKLEDRGEGSDGKGPAGQAFGSPELTQKDGRGQMVL